MRSKQWKPSGLQGIHLDCGCTWDLLKGEKTKKDIQENYLHFTNRYISICTYSEFHICPPDLLIHSFEYVLSTYYVQGIVGNY